MSKMKKKSTIILASVLVVLSCALIVSAVLLISHLQKDKYTVDKGSVIMTVDGIDIYENQFRFFATLILEQEQTVYSLIDSEEIDQNASVKTSVVNFVKEYIFRLREAQAANLSLTDEEKNSLKETMAAEYEANKTVDDEVLEGDRFYDYYYGLTEEQLTQFWTDWALVEKYNTQCEEQADTSRESQQLAYDEFYDNLYGCNAVVLSLSLDKLSDSEKAVKIALANELRDMIEGGDDMLALIKKHCDDESLVELEGKIKITPALESTFKEVCDWMLQAEVGDIDVVETDSAVYVLRCESIVDFDVLYNTDDMLTWTRLFIVNKQITDLVKSDKYPSTVHSDVYNAFDLTGMIRTAIAQWEYIWGLNQTAS